MKAIEFKLHRCSRCVLSERFPNISFDSEGVCNFCRSEEAQSEPLSERRRKWQERLDGIFEGVRGSPTGPYDCVVALSGGKDSSYTLMLMVRRYSLRCLAVTIDNGYLSSQAINNCRAVCDHLGVDHQLFKPSAPFMKKLVKESATGTLHVPGSITRASEICNSCIKLINTRMLNIALEQNIPVVAGGYLGGQVPKDSVVLEIKPRILSASRRQSDTIFAQRLGDDAPRYFHLRTEGVETDRKVIVVNPLLAFDYHESEIVAAIASVGWARPNDTGATSSNCRLNDVGIHLHMLRHGFHPYEAEFADLVRHGLMARKEAVGRLETMPSPHTLRQGLHHWDLDEFQN